VAQHDELQQCPHKQNFTKFARELAQVHVCRMTKPS
jgi:hypothetical protein